ncbi:MAG: L-serine ammonia-lyase, iron-sulfur-dependent, subunit alpha [bacterium]|nr:L-serine ammonia-lyase, iron-sulfur-dependent, subunit alpha [bacterium]MDY2650817.1 L-serine ammonia-lyase, iron-sulfur-dependent, subunit alpha [Candidatus Egerieousia sp.]
MTPSERASIIALIKQEVIPAIGCTEPIAVALCVAKATEILGCKPHRIEAHLSANILKNAMGVGIPGTGMIGLPIAIALGALIGKSEYGLEVLKECTPDAVEAGKRMIADEAISIKLKEGITEKLYIEITAFGATTAASGATTASAATTAASCAASAATTASSCTQTATAIIAGGHTNFIYLSHNGEVLLDAPLKSTAEQNGNKTALTLKKVYDFATTAPLEEIEFILEAQRLNKAAAETSFKGRYGHQLGRTLKESTREMSILGNNTFSKILSYTTAACDARMAGVMVPVMSNSGSGNQGITATLPITIYAEENNKSREELIRALTLSHLTVIYIKQSLGRLSALCGCVVAATGSSCGITYLMGGGYNQISFAVQNMIATLTGMVCDGAKPSCSLKIASGVSTSLLSAILAMEEQCVSSVEGIIDNDVDKSILNLTRIGSESMNETDHAVLDIMTHKGC